MILYIDIYIKIGYLINYNFEIKKKTKNLLSTVNACINVFKKFKFVWFVIYLKQFILLHSNLIPIQK